MASKKVAKRGVAAILIDTSAEMMSSLENPKNGKTIIFDEAKETADWILCRKMFSTSTDRIILIAYGTQTTQNPENIENCHLYSEDFESASFDHLRFINNEIEPNPNGEANPFDAIALALKCLEKIENVDDEAKTIAIIGSGAGLARRSSGKTLNDHAEDLVAENIDCYAISPLEENAEVQLHKMIKMANGQIFTFDSILPTLSNFAGKEKTSKNQTKNWEIAPDVSLPLCFSLKSTKTTGKGLKFTLSDQFGNKVVKVSQLQVENEQGEVESFAKIPKNLVEGTSTSTQEVEETVTISKRFEIQEDEKCSGYFFGKSLIFFDDEIIKEEYNNHNFNDGSKGGCLKLIQFTKKRNIHHSFLLGERSFTVLPAFVPKMKTKELRSAKCAMTIIEEMANWDTVALCRYAYNAASQPQLMALVPHAEPETGVYFLRAVFLPFLDDIKSLKFPRLEPLKNGNTHEDGKEEEEDSTKPTIQQDAAIDDLIDVMDLDEATTEMYTNGGVTDPQYQLQCHFLKNKVLKPEGDVEENMKNAQTLMDRIMAPRKEGAEKNSDFFTKLGTIFNLNKVEKTKRETNKLETVNIETVIDEWQNRKGEDSPTAKKRKTEKSRRDELEEEFYTDAEAAATTACQNSLRTIGQMCQFPDNVSRKEFFKLLIKELAAIRELCVFYAQIPAFNDYLTTLRKDESYRAFAECLAESKEILPIHHQDMGGSTVSIEEAFQFWDDIES